MAQRWTLEIKVGAFIVLGMALFIVFIFAIGDLSTTLQPGYRLRVLFNTANGITDGSPVQYAGVEVGKVKAVHVLYPKGDSRPKVELIAHLPSYVTVRADDEASISTFGLLGEKYLEITPGPGVGGVLKPDGRLIGKPPVSTEHIIERSNEVLTELKQTLQGINSLVGDPEARIYLKETIQEARDATRNWKLIGQRLNLGLSYAESGQGSLGKLLYDDELYQRMAGFIEDIRAHPWKLLVRQKDETSDTGKQKSK
ncbi:MAG: MCE family protein [Candidatus Omnitrophica bacterium]|nr:MCE family protein [Candidatus Omnitrophota bacterium]MBI3021246.1 MCE family protein [Candidatus Omnitrophota bacterium]MBI3083375.1 MCE family protein [Candidatus Omnitrophota bacterium]